MLACARRPGLLHDLPEGVHQIGGGGRGGDLAGGERVNCTGLRSCARRFNQLGNVTDGVVLGGRDIACCIGDRSDVTDIVISVAGYRQIACDLGRGNQAAGVDLLPVGDILQRDLMQAAHGVVAITRTAVSTIGGGCAGLAGLAPVAQCSGVLYLARQLPLRVVLISRVVAQCIDSTDLIAGLIVVVDRGGPGLHGIAVAVLPYLGLTNHLTKSIVGIQGGWREVDQR